MDRTFAAASLTTVITLVRAAADDIHPQEPRPSLSANDVIDASMWHLGNTVELPSPSDQSASITSAFNFVIPGPTTGSTASEFEAIMRTSYADVLASDNYSLSEQTVAQTGAGPCVVTYLTSAVVATRSAVRWCLEQDASQDGNCSRCWLIKSFDRVSAMNGNIAPIDESILQGDLSGALLLASNESQDELGSDFKLGLGIALGIFIIVGIVIAVMLIKLFRQRAAAAANTPKVQRQHSSILYSPSRLTGEDWKVPLPGSGNAFDFSPFGKAPSLSPSPIRSPSPSMLAGLSLRGSLLDVSKSGLGKSKSPLSKQGLTLTTPPKATQRNNDSIGDADTSFDESKSTPPSSCTKSDPPSPWAV